MPSNYILINSSMEYIVGDSKMEEFLQYLEENGQKVKTCAGNPPDTVVDEANKPEVVS